MENEIETLRKMASMMRETAKRTAGMAEDLQRINVQSMILPHEIPELGKCPVNITRGGGLRHVLLTQSSAAHTCMMCGEPLVLDTAKRYWVRWVIQEMP